MRYNEILEAKQEFDLETLHKILNECSEAVSLIKKTNKFMIRGTHGRNTNTGIFKDVIRPDRLSRDTNAIISSFIDEWLVEHNFTAIRSNSLFVSSNWIQANQYGTLYIIFPKNGFKYTWFEKSADLYDTVSNPLFFERARILYDIEIKNPQKTNQEIIKLANEHIKNKLNDDMIKISPTTSNIEKALKKKNEIMITGVDYYGVNYRMYKKAIKEFLGII